MQPFIFLNDTFVTQENAQIHVTDLGLLRGYGIFDFFRAIDGKPIFLEEHLDRFEASAAKMYLNIPFERAVLKQIIQDTIAKNPMPTLGIKMILTGGYSADGFTPSEKSNLIVLPTAITLKSGDIGMKLITLEHRRELPEIKTLNYIVPINALPKMKAAGADDVLYHLNGEVSEMSRSNIFIVKNEKIITPTEGVLLGITRKNVLAVAKQYFEVEERPLMLKELFEADEVFTTGSTKRVTFIEKIDQKTWERGKVTAKLQNLILGLEK